MAKLQEILTFDFDDVRLIPGKCQVKSRSEIDTSVKFGAETFRLPLVPANMSTIVDENLAAWLAKNGYFYVMHRFGVDPVEFTRAMHEMEEFSSISLGVQEEDYHHIARLKELPVNPEYITIDIAHGHAPSVVAMIEHIRAELPNSFIIAGNVATPAAVRELEAAGAHGLKVGVGPGLACLTAPNTGFGTQKWQLSAIEWCAEAATDALIIADGGIRTYGDIAKALAFGAHMVMVGGMLAAHDESPGEFVVDEGGNKFKSFMGSASAEQKGESKHVEGQQMLLPYRGSLKDTFAAITEALQSSVSYSGGTSIEDLRDSHYALLR